MSRINKIKMALQSILAQFAKLSTDKGLLSSEDDEIVVGSNVMLVDDEGNESKPEDGEYKADDGVVYVIEDGKVSEIREPENENEEPEEAPAEENFSLIHRMAVKFESFLEKEDKIRAGLAAKGIDGWLVDAGDDFVVVGVWNDEEMQDKFWRYDVSWDEEGNAVIGNGEEVKSAFVPVEEEVEKTPEEAPAEENFEEQEEPEDKDQRIADLEAEVARLEEENGALKAENEELKKKLDEPAAEPATEQFEKANKGIKTGNKSMRSAARSSLARPTASHLFP